MKKPAHSPHAKDRQARMTVEILLAKYLKAAINYRGIDRIESLPMPEYAAGDLWIEFPFFESYTSTHQVLWNPYGACGYGEGVCNPFHCQGMVRLIGKERGCKPLLLIPPDHREGIQLAVIYKLSVDFRFPLRRSARVYRLHECGHRHTAVLDSGELLVGEIRA